MNRLTTLSLAAVALSTSTLAAFAFTGCDPQPPLSVQPSADLNAIQRVTVSGSSSSWYLQIYQCIAGQIGTCRRVGQAYPRDTGVFSLSLEVQQTYEGGVCDAPGKCELAFNVSDASKVSAPLSFKPVGAPVLGTLEASSSITAGETLSVVGRNWASNTAVRSDVVAAAEPWTMNYRIADASGAFSDAPRVRGFLVNESGAIWVPVSGTFKDLRDCVSTPGSCALVGYDYRASSASIRVPLTVRQGAAATGTARIEQSMPLPYASISPTPVDIQGSGWQPNRTLEAYQCASHLRLCMAMPAITTDAAGAFRVQTNVYYGATHSSPESGLSFTCSQPGACVVVVADDRAGLDGAARIPLHYAQPSTH